MKILFSIIILIGVSGCITMNPCPYCKERNYASEESMDEVKLYGNMSEKNARDGDIIKVTRTLKWSHIYRVHRDVETHLQKFPDYYEDGQSR